MEDLPVAGTLFARFLSANHLGFGRWRGAASFAPDRLLRHIVMQISEYRCLLTRR
jgi:hypothetical protein